jgi:predicted cobalt transporter CbtA
MLNGLAQFLLTSSLLRGNAAAFATKLAASIAGFTMFALSSRCMDPASFGSLAMILNVGLDPSLGLALELTDQSAARLTEGMP